MPSLRRARISQATPKASVSKKPISDSAIEKISRISKDEITKEATASNVGKEMTGGGAFNSLQSSAVDEAKIGNSTQSLGAGRTVSTGGYNTDVKTIDEYQAEAAAGLWTLTKMTGGAVIGVAGAAVTCPIAAAGIAAGALTWNTVTNSIDAITGNYDPVGHGVGAAGNIIGMLPVPGAGVVGTAISVGYSGSTAGDEPSEDKEGGDRGPDRDAPNNGGKKDDDTNNEDKNDDDSDDDTDDDTTEEQCTEETKDQEEGGDTSDSNSEEGSGTDNPMNEGYDGPPLVLKLGKEEWVPDYDSDGGSTNKASSRNTLGNWGETEASSGSAMPGTRQDYDVITQAGGGHTDPGENDLWSPQSYYFDPLIFNQIVFKANGGGTKAPLLGSYNSAGFYKDDTDPNDPGEPDTGSDGQEGNSGSINPFRGLIGSGPIGAGFIGHASNSGLLAALEGSLTANTEALQSNSSILA